MANPTDKDKEIAENDESFTAPSPHKRPESKQATTGQTAIKSVRQETAIDLEEMRSPEEVYENLDPERQVLMQLGFHSGFNFEIRPITEDQRVISINGTSETIESFVQAVKEEKLLLPLNTPIVELADSEISTRLFLVNSPNTPMQLATMAKSMELDSKPDSGLEFATAQNPRTSIIRIGPNVIILNDSLLSHTPIAPIYQVGQFRLSHKQPENERTLADTYDLERLMKGTPLPWKTPSFSARSSSDKRAISEKDILAGTLSVACQPERFDENMIEEVAYQVIDIHSLLQDPAKNADTIRQILDRVSSLADSPDFLITMDQVGNLIIIDFAQRGGGYIGVSAAELFKTTGEKVNIRAGAGTLHKSGKSIRINGYASQASSTKWRKMSAKHPAVYVTPADHKIMSSGRNTTNYSYTTSVVEENPEFLKISGTEKKIRLHIGGPDRLIGHETELAKLKAAMQPNSGNKLAIVSGPAGSGKSRLLNEALKEHPEAILVSFDASTENLPGASLMELATKVAEAVEARIGDEIMERYVGQDLAPLLAFSKDSEDARIQKTHRAPKEIAQWCINALTILKRTNGHFPLTIDDLHHIDSHSAEHIMAVFKAMKKNSVCPIVWFRRPEEKYHSSAEKNMVRTLMMEEETSESRSAQSGFELGHSPALNQRIKTVEIIHLHDPETGKPKLDLKDRQIAYDYVFYSLPEEIRINQNTGQKRSLGNWPSEIAAKCRTPFDLTSIINSLLEDPQKAFNIGSDRISLKRTMAEKLNKINNDQDLLSLHRNRIRKLAPESRAILQCIAILGSKLSYSDLMSIARDIIQIPDGEDIKAIETLYKGGYILPGSPHEKQPSYELQHDNYRELALSSMGTSTRNSLIMRVYLKFQQNPRVPNDRKFAMLAQLVDNMGLKQPTGFWDNYIERANLSLTEGKRERSYSRNYSIAMTVLGELDTTKKPQLGKALQQLRIHHGAIPKFKPEMKKLIIDSLVSVVENGLNLGRFDKMNEAITALEEIGAEEHLTAAYLAGFKGAQIQWQLEKMAEFYDKAITRPDLKPVDKLSMDIRKCLKGHKFGQAQQLFAEHAEMIKALKQGTDEEQVTAAEFTRLEQRVKFEQIRTELENKGADGDVLSEPGNLDETSTSLFLGILEELTLLNNQRKQNPDLFSPMQELHLLDQMAEMSAFLGRYPEAVESLTEVWHLAQQMKIPVEAARAARIKGDVKVMQGIVQITHPTQDGKGQAIVNPNGTILRKYILQAIQAYTEEGLAVIEDVDPTNEQHLFQRGQRVRAISILVMSYENELKEALANVSDTETSLERIKEELLPHLKTALNDFNFSISSPIWGPKFTDPAMGGFYSFYGTSPMGHILACIDELGITEEQLSISIPDILDSNNPAFNHEKSLKPGITTASAMRDNVDEIDKRKLPGFDKLVDLGQRRALASNNIAATRAFQQLRYQLDDVLSKRQPR